MVSLQLAAKENERRLSIRTILNDLNFQILERIVSEGSVYESLFTKSPTFLDLLDLSGAAIKVDRQYRLIGETPNEEQVENLIHWARFTDMNTIYSTHVLPHVHPESFDYKEKASGIIIIPIAPKDRNYIFGFREEVVQTIHWGGNPNDAIQFESDGNTYHPRNSFAQWKEEVVGISKPWLPQEIEVAEKLLTSILEKLLNDKS